MMRPLATPLSALLLGSTLLFAVAVQAGPHQHGAAHAHDSSVSLQLNAGKKWATDAALRQSMDRMRQHLEAALPEIHADRLGKPAYKALAHKLEAEINEIVQHCKLEPQADAQLHLVLADMLAAIAQMSGKDKQAKRRDGAVKAIGALDKYARYFDDPGFKPIAH